MRRRNSMTQYQDTLATILDKQAGQMDEMKEQAAMERQDSKDMMAMIQKQLQHTVACTNAATVVLQGIDAKSNPTTPALAAYRPERVPKFNGAGGVAAASYIRHVNNLAERTINTAHHRSVLLFDSLGPAEYNWANQVFDQSKWDRTNLKDDQWTEFVEAFYERFIGTREQIDSLFDAVQQEDEGDGLERLDDYLDRVMALARLTGRDQDESRVIEKAIRGMRDHAVKGAIVGLPNDGQWETFKRGVRLAMSRLDPGPYTRAARPPTIAPRARGNPRLVHSIDEGNQGWIDDSAASAPTHVNVMAAAVGGASPAAPRPWTCYHCFKTGHRRFECPKKRAEDDARAAASPPGLSMKDLELAIAATVRACLADLRPNTPSQSVPNTAEVAAVAEEEPDFRSDRG
ncbi:hypothetical protein SPRG_17130 [Saprolegnia parasitica CBS 223.65]|uniref:CCHC-type domain-containing protein n=1 Tax=Saprolegnia parasitica (strain CBS 223.65) TaxID=695850 RepID=A0A067BL48_SAPPC|nr:hypothetical protein SPRG_17130 [Saprolegnia parasitica CBS 223.65]KDO17455.1 hypothetical protein SPRG_17130 [Saprolegnia parasitica CBS 223.65]|eukprot:XP_012211838.1 hypothetical protein SPRG_17130 [Saprolegnia parasitica CBS 223.65]